MKWPDRIVAISIGSASRQTKDGRVDVQASNLLASMLAMPAGASLDAAVHTSPEADGVALDYRIRTVLPPSSIALADVLDHAGQPLGAREQLFADDQNRFLVAAEVHARQCRLYIPYGAIDYDRAGMYTVRLRCFWYGDQDGQLRAFGQASHPLGLPSPPAWDKWQFIDPLLSLYVRMIRVDGDVQRGELRAIIDWLADNLALRQPELDTLREVIEKPSSLDIGELVDEAMRRFGLLSPRVLIGLLAELAWADEWLDSREFALLRQVAEHLRMSEAEWLDMVRAHRLQE